MEKLSVTIICGNEENNIEECIKSILWADEIILVDSYSKDKTIVIASKFEVKIFQNKWESFASQRQFALSKCTNEWVFSIDADERCSPLLADEIKEKINFGTNNFAGYRMPRKSFFLNKWVKHGGWYPDYQLRLFKKQATVSERLVHEKYEVEGELGIMKNDLLHYTVSSISEYMQKVNQYSTLQSIEKSKNRKINFLNMLFRPTLAFIQGYIFKGGFLDGITGLMVVNFHIITNMLTFMKIWQIQNKKKS